MKGKTSFEDLEFDHYYDYEELTQALKILASEKPSISRLSSIGKTPEGRDLWLMELTNFETGPPEDKPAMWLDGNTHAAEVTGSMVCLKTIWHLIKNYGADPDVTRLLNETTFYILPRIDADGAEFSLKTPYYVLGGDNETGGGRWYPLSKEEWTEKARGLYMEDVNGDGFITRMRIEDPNGDWKPSDKDSRIMVRREPGEAGGPFYRVYPEGLILNHDGTKDIKMAPPRWSLNFNRNYPDDWAKEEIGRGSGPYPLSEPETRAVADFIIGHPNICLAVTYHTQGGFVIGRSESETLSPHDRNLFRVLESIFERETGYPARSFIPRRPRTPSGSFSSYMTLHRAIPCVTVELWDLGRLTGTAELNERKGPGPGRTGSQEERELMTLKWDEKEFNGEHFVNWSKFDHPQLGEVEIGGWKSKYLTRNPPEAFLEDEIDKVMHFPFKWADLLPRVSITESGVKKIDENIYEVKITVANEGALPTYVMEHAMDIGAAAPVEVLVELGDEMKLVNGEKIETMHLEGYLNRELAASRMERKYTADKHKKTLRWLVEARKPGEITIKASAKKAGQARVTMIIAP